MGQQEGCGEVASFSLLQPAGSQEIEQIESGTFVEDKTQTLELDEEKMDIKKRQLGEKEKSLYSLFRKRFRYSLR